LNVLRFHEVNNLLGYQNGDRLLRHLGDILRQKAGKTTLIARTGSSEFALLLSGQQVTTLLPEIMKELAVVLKEYDPAHRMRLCCGISSFPEQCTTPVELFQFAELALSVAKKNSSVSVQHFNIQMQSTFQRRRELATQLRAELKLGSPTGLYLCYQPIHVADDPHSLGVEVLLRWKHVSFGFVPPPEVIEIAEEHGLGDVLGDWIFRRVIADLSSLPSSVLPRLSVAVNLSESMFAPTLSDRVVQLFRQGPLRPQQLILELTETIALHDFSVSQQILTSLREAGIRIALDDFGTGYSSLAYLKDLPVDKLKLDESFIQQIHLDARQLQLVRHITELAHGLGLTVVAEGVESAAEQAIVVAIGVEEIQGYHYSRPLELPQLRHYLQRYFQSDTTV
ncbi:MAG: bifunctional diguanylate cyclase/phosphodiesterase, partial [Tolumonas sp.]